MNNEVNQVTIPIYYYNELRDFKINHGKEYKQVNLDGGKFVFYTNDEIQKELYDKIRKLEIALNESINLYSSLILHNADETIKLKRMSIWKFKKWRNE